MKKTLSSVCIVALTLFLSLPLSASASTYYDSYAYDSRGQSIPVPNSYTVTNMVSGENAGTKAFSAPQDLCVDKKSNRIYMADTANNRIVVLREDYTFECEYSSITEAPDGVEQLKEPQGVFVSARGDIYVCDTGNFRVIKMNEKGQCLTIYNKPKTDLFPTGLEYKPLKLVVDEFDGVYVLAYGIYNGFIKYDADGTFKGFFGGNRVEITPEVIARQLWKKIFTDDQIQASTRVLPIEYSNAVIDSNNFIYTVVLKSRTNTDQLKKLNAKGDNVLRINAQDALYRKNKFGDLETGIGKNVLENRFVAVDVAEDGIISILDGEKGHVFQYDHEANLLFLFGKKGSESHSFEQPVDIVSFKKDYLVLDSAKNRIAIFRETAYAASVKQALSKYANGNYSESIEICKRILKKNANCSIAYVSIGKALQQQGDYREAMKYLKQGEDRTTYSLAFKEYRMQFLRKYFFLLLAGFILLIAGCRIGYRKLKSWMGYTVVKKKMIYK